MPAKDNSVTIRVISEKKGLLQIERQWNTLANEYSNSPFLLSEFAKQYIEYIPDGWVPMILAISSNQKIIGIAPMKTKNYLTGRHVDFMFPGWCSEFIFDDQHRGLCIKYTLDFLFTTLKCHYGRFILPSDSPNLKPLSEECKLKKIHIETAPAMGRRIIPIKSTWNEYEALRTRKFRRELMRIERNLTKQAHGK